ncbi:hypothetical protein F2P79_021908 [Pimephales promelas]|nr:hypothetical protein F2P79_021908 [Pimephales promelas]
MEPWKRGNPSTDKQQTSVSHCCFLCFQIIIDVLLHPLGSKTISTAMTSTRQDLDAIHTQYMTKVFWDPQWKASRREMLAGQMYLYTTPTSAFTWMADYYHVL